MDLDFNADDPYIRVGQKQELSRMVWAHLILTHALIIWLWLWLTNRFDDSNLQVCGDLRVSGPSYLSCSHPMTAQRFVRPNMRDECLLQLFSATGLDRVYRRFAFQKHHKIPCVAPLQVINYRLILEM